MRSSPYPLNLGTPALLQRLYSKVGNLVKPVERFFFPPYIFSLAYFSVATLFSFFLVTALLVFLGLVIIEAAPLSE